MYVFSKGVKESFFCELTWPMFFRNISNTWLLTIHNYLTFMCINGDLSLGDSYFPAVFLEEWSLHGKVLTWSNRGSHVSFAPLWGVIWHSRTDLARDITCGMTASRECASQVLIPTIARSILISPRTHLRPFVKFAQFSRWPNFARSWSVPSTVTKF